METNKGTRGLRCERDNLGAQPPPYHPSQGRVRGAARTTTMSAMRPLVAPGHAAPRVTQLARRRRPAGAARGNEMHSQLPVGSRRVGSGPRPARRAIVGTHEAPYHVANVSTGGSDSASQQPGGGGGGSGAAPSGTTLLVSIHGKLDYGLQMGISGDATEFGNWKPEKAYILKWTEGDVWTARVDIPPTVKEVKYKLLTTYKGMEFDWEDFGNRTLDLTPGGGDAICRISGEYGQALDVQISPRPQPGPPRRPPRPRGSRSTSTTSRRSPRR